MQNYLNCKILAMPLDVPVKIGRRVPEISPIGSDFTLEQAQFYLGLGNLKGTEAQKDAGEVVKKFGLNPNSRVEFIESLFGRKNFPEALKPSILRGTLNIVYQMIRSGKYYEARTLTTRILEFGSFTDDQQLGLRFIKAQTENNPENKVAAIEGIKHQTPYYHPGSTLDILCRYQIALTYLSAGEYKKAESSLRKNFPSTEPGLSEAIAALLEGDISAARGNQQEALRLYAIARASLNKQLTSTAEFRLNVIDSLKKAGVFRPAGSSIETIPLAAGSSDPVGAMKLLFGWSFHELLSNLHVGILLREITLQKDKESLNAAAKIEQIESMLRDRLPVLADEKGKQALWLTLGDYAFSQSRHEVAEKYFIRAGASLFHALTRLNEIGYEALSSAPAPLPESEVKIFMGRLDAELKKRLKEYPDDSKDEIISLQLQKLAIGQKARFFSACREALNALLDLTKGTPMETMVLVYAAGLPFVSEEIADRARTRAILPDTLVSEKKNQKEVARTLFGTDDEDLLPEIVLSAAREIRKRRVAEPAKAVSLPKNLSEIHNLLAVYQAKAAEIESRCDALLESTAKKERPLFWGEAMNPYRSIAECGISSIEFRISRDQAIVTLQVLFNDGSYVETPFSKGFNFSLAADPGVNRLLTLVIKDFFLALQLGGNYESVFEKADFKFYLESEFLNELRLKSRLHAIVSRPETPSEEALKELETKALKTPFVKKEGEEGEEKEIDRKKQIFQFKSFRDLLRTQKITLDIPRLASLLPLAQLLDHMEINTGEGGADINLYCGNNVIRIFIDPEGNIKISDQNRGSANLKLIRQMNEAILDIINAHFIPDYKEALASNEPRTQIENIYRFIQETAAARQKKWELYRKLKPEERAFSVEAVPGQPHPFESIFFEIVQTAPVPKLQPLPTMGVKTAIEAVNSGRRLAQVGIVGLHSRKRPTSASQSRMDEYILRFILRETQPLNNISAEDRAAIESIKQRILSGDTSTDPYGIIKPDPENPKTLTMDDVLVVQQVDKREVLRTHKTFVRPHLRLFEMTGINAYDMKRLQHLFEGKLNFDPSAPASTSSKPGRKIIKWERTSETPSIKEQRAEKALPKEKLSNKEQAGINVETRKIMEPLKIKHSIDWYRLEELSGISATQLWRIYMKKKDSTAHILAVLKTVLAQFEEDKT